MSYFSYQPYRLQLREDTPAETIETISSQLSMTGMERNEIPWHIKSYFSPEGDIIFITPWDLEKFKDLPGVHSLELDNKKKKAIILNDIISALADFTEEAKNFKSLSKVSEEATILLCKVNTLK